MVKKEKRMETITFQSFFPHYPNTFLPFRMIQITSSGITYIRLSEGKKMQKNK